MVQNKIFSNILKKSANLALFGALIATLTPSIIWGMANEEDKKCTSINRLPKSVLGYIFSFIDQPTELGRLALVSKRWKEVSEMDIRWKRFGVESKKEFEKFMKSHAIAILNKSTQTSHEIGIAYGSRPYFTELNSSMKGESFNEYIWQVQLPINQKTVLRFCDFPKETTALGPQKIYGLTKLPGDTIPLSASAIFVDTNKSIEFPTPPVIWEILRRDSTVFGLDPEACSEHMPLFWEYEYSQYPN